MEQKFKNGDRVKVKVGHPIWQRSNGKVEWMDMMPELTQDIATVEYTYGEKSETDYRFSKGEEGYKEYSLKFDNHGSISWFNEDVIYLYDSEKNTKEELNKL